jgi:cytochrome c biogenesis protein ResB
MARSTVVVRVAAPKPTDGSSDHVNKLKRFITARRVSLGLILLLAGLMYLSTVIPQEIDSSPEKIAAWRRVHVGVSWPVDALHLHSIYSTPWFAAAILFAALALGISSYDQLIIARRKLSSTANAPADEVASGIAKQHLRSVASFHHYRSIRTAFDWQLKFVRNPWGYFGTLLLHIGMTLAITVSLYVALTARQGALILVEGEQRNNLNPWNVSEHGLFASPLKLPGTIRLDRVRLRFDDKHQPIEVFSDISITDSSGRIESMTASINRILQYHGMRIYHAAQYGNAFTVTVTDKSGAIHSETIAAQQPTNPAESGYSDEFGVKWSPYLLSAKYYADADKKTMDSTNPELTLRLTRGSREIARTTLIKGGSGMLGEYRVQLNEVAKWSKLIVVDSTGIALIFTGFAIIMLGGLLQYLAPPRELIAVKQQDDLYVVYWKAAAFRDFFLDEREDVAMALQRETAA